MLHKGRCPPRVVEVVWQLHSTPLLRGDDLLLFNSRLGLTYLDRVAEAVAERQHDREELRVAHEELVKLAQRLRRGGLLRRAYLPGHLPAPEKVVHDDDAADAQQRQGKFEIAAILLLHGVS